MEVVSPLHSNNKMKRQQYSFGADRRVNGNGRRFSTDNIDRSIEAAIAAAANGADESVESQNVNSDSAEEFTLNLIEAVRNEPCLYDPSNEQYGNRNMSAQYRNAVWQKLCHQLNFEGGAQTLQAQWKQIRDRHVREKRRRKFLRNKNDELNSSQRTAARYFDAMHWIDEFINDSTTLTPTTSNTGQNLFPTNSNARRNLKRVHTDLSHPAKNVSRIKLEDADNCFQSSSQNYLTVNHMGHNQITNIPVFPSSSIHYEYITNKPNQIISIMEPSSSMVTNVGDLAHFHNDKPLVRRQSMTVVEGLPITMDSKHQINNRSQTLQPHPYTVVCSPPKNLSYGTRSPGKKAYLPSAIDQVQLAYDSEGPLVNMIVNHFRSLNDDEKTVTKINIQRIIMDARFGRGACLRMFKEEEQNELARGPQ